MLLTKLYPLSILTAAGGVLCGGPDYIISFVPLRSARIFRVSNVVRLEPSLLLYYLPLNIFTASKGSNFHILLYKIRNQVIQTNSWKSDEDILRPSWGIRKTCLCNIYPSIAHFYIAKLGYAGVYLFFLVLLQNIDCGYSLVLTCTPNLCFEQK